MAQHINTNQLHPMVNQIPMLSAAGLNLTASSLTYLSGSDSQLIMSTGQQHGMAQFTQGQPGMYQIVQQAPGQLQMQNVVHPHQQLNNIQHHQLQQTSYQQPQITHQQVQQLNNHHQLNNHAQIQIQQNQQIQQQIQHQSSGHQDNSTNNQQNANNNNNQQQQTTKQQTQQQSKSQKKKPKINKDGVPAPKRATTAYINFTQWYRESIKKTGRTVPKIGEFGKECAAKWNSMTEDEKKPFTEVAARDRDRYRREMEIYKPARDANKPKRPGTAFMLFMVDFRKEVAGKEPEGGVAALAKLGGERWRGMTDEEKKPYVDQQNECKIRYEKLMEDYRQKNGQPPIIKKEGTKEENSEINSVADSENSEQPQNNGDIKQTHSPGSNASPTQNQSPHEEQQQQQLDGLATMNMPDFSSNDNFNQAFNQQANSNEPGLYQQQHEQIEQQQIDQQLSQTHEQQDSSQFNQQNYNQHFQWN